jgi:C-terminal domain 7 of the ABC-three component (ABC-3C) systems
MSSSSHSAAPQALGYLYQCQWPLLELLQRSVDRPDCAITIEQYDDVAWERDGTPQELLQLKHHIGSQRSLGDKDSDWWRTIRVWMDAGEPGDPNGPTLTMVTTLTATDGTAAAALRPASYDPQTALRLLEDAARTSTEGAFRAVREAFLELREAEREVFVARMRVLDASPSISDLDSQVRRELFHALPLGHETTFMGLLWHWWYSLVVDMLQGERHRVNAVDVHIFIDDLRDKFTRDNLPTLVLLSELNEQEACDECGDLPFVHQIRWISVPSVILQTAIIDYYRAYTQQARWLEDDLIGWHEIEEFEHRLRDEWERAFSWAIADLDPSADEAMKQEIGRSLLRKTLDQTIHRVRERYSDPFFSRGKHHELANRRRSENGIGWHPDFERRLEELLLARAS